MDQRTATQLLRGAIPAGADQIDAARTETDGANPMAVTYTVDPETITFSEWHDGEEVGSGDARDIEELRQSGELLPDLAVAWDAMIVTVVDVDEAA